MKKISLLLVLAVFLLFSTGLYTGYKLLQKMALNRSVISLEAEFEAKTQEKSVLDVENAVEALNAKNMLSDLKSDITTWSSVVSAIKNAVPAKNGKPLLEVLSYSGSEGSKLSMNVTTGASSTAPYEDMAKFLESFDSNANFVDSFIPSVSAGYDDEGNEVLNFLFSTTYKAGSPNVLR